MTAVVDWKMEEWIRTCLSKCRYRSEARAKAVMKKRARWVQLRYYDCPHCGGWHLTKQPAPKP